MQTILVPSKSNPSKPPYEVILHDDGSVYCPCKGFGYRRDCTHIAEARSQQLAAQPPDDTLEQQLVDSIQRLSIPQLCRTPNCGALLTGTHAFQSYCPACIRQQTFHSTSGPIPLCDDGIF